MTGIFSASNMLKSLYEIRLWVKMSKRKSDTGWKGKTLKKLNQDVTLVLPSLWAVRSMSSFLMLHKTSVPPPAPQEKSFELPWRCLSFLPNKDLRVMHILTPGLAILIYRLCSCMWQWGRAPSWQAVRLPSGTAPWTALTLGSFQQL